MAQAAGVLFSRLLLPFPERLAVRALIHRWIGFMRTHPDAVERAVVCGGAVVRTLGDGAFNAFVGFAVIHLRTPPFKVLYFADGDATQLLRRS